ncbi:MAG: VOC family protein [Devosia sp.]
MAPPPFDQLVTFIYTDDLEAAAHFYGEVLELPLALDQGSCRIYAVGPAGFLGVCRKAGEPQTRDGVIVTLVSNDVNGWHAHLAAKGVTFEKPPTLYEDYNIYHCFLRDPAGYLLEIQTFLDPSWPKPVGASG